MNNCDLKKIRSKKGLVLRRGGGGWGGYWIWVKERSSYMNLYVYLSFTQSFIHGRNIFYHFGLIQIQLYTVNFSVSELKIFYL